MLGLFLGVRICFRIDESIYSIDDTVFELIVKEYEFDGNKLSLTLSGQEDLIGTYYISTYDEFLNLGKLIKYGVKVRLVGSLEVASKNTIPNTFNYREYLSNKDIFYTLKIDSIEVIDSNVSFIYYVKNVIIKRIDSIDVTGYMKAFILGNKNYIDSNTYNKYQKIGVTHLFALSGMHVGLLSGVILKLLKRINVLGKYIIVDVLLIIYGFIVGFPSSIKRCVLFFLINSINKIFKLDLSSLKVMLLVVFLLILSNYKIIYDVGFVYSVVTVMGIIFCNDFISCDNKLLSAFRLSLVAFIFSMPISLSCFYEVNLLSFIYNIIYVPYVSIIVYPLSLISFITPSLINVFSFFINFMEIVSKYLSSLSFFNLYMDFNMIEIILYYLITLFMFYKYEYRLGFLLILIVIFDLLIPYFNSTDYVYFFDVGQGDSSLIISSYGKEIVLIDTGGLISYVKDDWMKKDKSYVSDNIILFLKSIGISSITSLIISHGDYDHMGEAINLVNNFKVEKVIFNCGEFNELEQDLIINDNKLYFLNDKDYANENDNSSVIYTKLNNRKFLFMGDAGVEVEEDLIEKYNLQDIDVLKVGHHGSRTSSSEYFINELNPKYSIISVGKNNRYGHPNDGVLENLKDSKIYRTDQDGSIMFKVEKNKMNIEASPP